MLQGKSRGRNTLMISHTNKGINFTLRPILFFFCSLMEIERDHDAVPLLKRALSLDPTNNEAESLLNQIQYKPPLITLVSVL